LRAELDKALVSGDAEKIAELTSAYNEAGAEIEQLSAKHQEAMNSIAYNLFVAKLQAGEFTDAEYEMALAAGVSLGIIDKKTAETAKNFDAIATAAANSEGGAEKFGDVIKETMSDGEITSAELQVALDKINTDKATVEINQLANKLNEIPTEIDVTITQTTENVSGDDATRTPVLRGGYANGGMITAPGDGYRDTMLAPVANGEYIVNSAAVRRPGVLQTLERLNSGEDAIGAAGMQNINIYGQVTMVVSGTSADILGAR
jgi:hypothetical protein